MARIARVVAPGLPHHITQRENRRQQTFFSAVPSEKENLRLAIGEAHRRYTRRVNFREGWRGHLWQGRFSSYVMDERYLLACARYIENNPVQAGLADRADGWSWSSAKSHIGRKNDKLVNVEPLLSMVKEDWSDFLWEKIPSEEQQEMHKHERTGRPLGSIAFIEQLESMLNLSLKPKKPGRKPKT